MIKMPSRTVVARTCAALCLPILVLAGAAPSANAASAARQAPRHAPGTAVNRVNSVPPPSSSGCVGNLPWNNVKTCIEINGTGLFVNWMQATGCVNNTAFYGHLQLTGPSGFSRNGTSQITSPGNCFPPVLWAPEGNVTSGQYCATTWQRLSGGGYQNDGTACKSVTP